MTEKRLKDLIAEELNEPLWPAIESLADAVRARFPAGAVQAVLFYGSCLRDRNHTDKVVDFYAIASSYGALYRGHRIARIANAILPPSVYYQECEGEGGEILRAKVAIVSMEDFQRLTSKRALHPYLWGRFSQKVVLVGKVKPEVADQVAGALASASVTLQQSALPLMPAEGFSAKELWTRALRESYRTEIRAESKDRAREIVEASAARYDAQTRAAVQQSLLPLTPLDDGRFKLKTSEGVGRASRAWFFRRLLGRFLHVLRLIKGAYTYADGLAYILWKIGRHTGAVIEPSKWQRRHPLLAAPFLLWRLWRLGAFRKN